MSGRMRAPPFRGESCSAGSREDPSRPRRGRNRHLGSFSRLNHRLSGCRENDLPRRSSTRSIALRLDQGFLTLPSFSTWMPSEAHKRISRRRTGDRDRMEEQPAGILRSRSPWLLGSGVELHRQDSPFGCVQAGRGNCQGDPGNASLSCHFQRKQHLNG